MSEDLGCVIISGVSHLLYYRAGSFGHFLSEFFFIESSHFPSAIHQKPSTIVKSKDSKCSFAFTKICVGLLFEQKKTPSLFSSNEHLRRFFDERTGSVCNWLSCFIRLQIWIGTGLATLFPIELVVANTMLGNQVTPVEVIPAQKIWGRSKKGENVNHLWSDEEWT